MYIDKVEGFLRVSCPKGYKGLCMSKDYVLTDLALGHCTSAYDIDFLYDISNGNGAFVTIGRLIDRCSDFKDFKALIGDDKHKQLKVIMEAWNLYDGSDCDGLNIYDTVEHVMKQYLYPDLG
jgi:hypothetical protein